MQPLNDDNLDRLSREAADQFELDTGALGWERLEKRLTQELPEEKDRRRFLFWLFFIAFVTGGGLLMMLGNGTQKPVGSRQLAVAEDKAQDTRDKEQGTRDKVQDTRYKVQDSEDKAQGSEPGEDGTMKFEAGSTKPATSNQKPVGSGQLAVTDNLSTGEQAPESLARIKTQNTKKNKGLLPVISNKKAKTETLQPKANDQDLATSQQPVPGTKESTTIPTQPAQQPVPDIQQPTTEPATRTLTLDPAPVTSDKKPESDQQPTTDAKKTIPRTKTPSSLEIALVVGPDWTYVKYWDSYKTGYNVGLQIGYRFNNRWSVNTGLTYTKKNYSANGDDFTAPKHSYISYQDLRYLKGYCSMFDIPVNIRYDVIANKTNRIFASAGLTSYIMRKQGYEYSYYNQSGQFRTSPWWDTDSTFKHFFSVVNISAGYEWMLNKKFSLQAEPYLKLPLKGLGYGAMRMESMGLNLSVKYRPFFK